jgi:hypothetical protein
VTTTKVIEGFSFVQMKYLAIKDLNRLQHYKAKRPAWIKLYAEILNNYDFNQLSDNSKWHLLGLGLVASQHDNHIPLDLTWLSKELKCARRLRTSDIDVLVSHGFIEIVGGEILHSSERDRTALNAPSVIAIPEKETERKEEKEIEGKKETKAKGEKEKKAIDPDEEWAKPSLNSSLSKRRSSIQTADTLDASSEAARLIAIIDRYQTPEAMIKAAQQWEISMDDVKAILNAK